MSAPGVMGSPATAPSRRWRNRTLLREPDVRRTRWMWGLLLSVVVAAAPFAVYLLEQMAHAQLRYRVDELRSQHARLVEAERGLRLKAAILEAPDRVESLAVRELGLVHPAANMRAVIRPAGPLRGSLMARAPDGNDGAR
jgi:cell division protein FtsL